MAKHTGMVIVERGGHRFKVRRNELATYLTSHPGAAVVEDRELEPVADGADTVPAPDAGDAETAVDALERESRATLDAMAVEHGIGNPAALPNKRAVAEAIYAAATDVHDRDDE